MENALIKNPLVLEILDKYRVIWALNHLSALGGWDLRVYMPPEGVETRGEALSKVASLSQKIFFCLTSL